MQPSPRPVTRDYFRRRLWLANLGIALSLLITVSVGWVMLSSFEVHGSYARVLTDLLSGIDDFESELAWQSGRPGTGEPRRLLRAKFKDIVELYTYLTKHDGEEHDDLDEQWRLIKYDLQINPDVLNARYHLEGKAMSPLLRALWHGSPEGMKALEVRVRQFLILGHKLMRLPSASSATAKADMTALRTMMRTELRPAFQAALHTVGSSTANTAQLAFYLLALAAAAGIGASLVSAVFIFQPMQRAVLAAQDALTAERDRALASDSAKDEFLSLMSHELRTPLNGILGFTNLLLGTPLNTKQKDYAETIQGAGVTLLDLLNDILDMTHIEAGSLEFENIAFSLQDVTSEVLSLLGPQAFAKRLDLAAYVDPHLPDSVAGDAGRVRQILLKLAANAIKFTERGGVAIEVKPAGMSPEGDCILLFTVTDTGIGIPQNKIGQVFDQFMQVDSSSSRKHGGAGLGLPICKKLVALMDGEMGVESTLGKGTTFWFKITLAEATPLSQNILENTRLTLAGHRFLVVDDNALNRRIFQQQLKSFGAEVHCVAGGRAALTALADAEDSGHPYEIVIIDHMMPEMDGITLRKLIRERPQYADVKLIISSSGGIAFDQQARALGFDAACPKPVVQDKLIRLLVALLERKGPPTAMEAAAVSGVRPRAVGEGTKGKYARLLIAEDNPINQRLITTALTQAGFVVDAVADGVEAVHAMQRLPYDLVLMDIRMPVMSGVDATRRIRAMPEPACRTPIIAMTANTLPGDRERYLAAGMNEYVPKPIDFEDLLGKIRRYLDGAALAARETEDVRRQAPEAQKKPA